MGSNAAENHPISFKHITKAQERGATVISVDQERERVVLDAGALALSKDRSTQTTSRDAGYGEINTPAAGIGRPRSRRAIRVAAVRPPPAESPATITRSSGQALRVTGRRTP